MFRLDNILQLWAEHYKPLSHGKKVRGKKVESFYRIDTLNDDNPMVKKYATAYSPALAYSTLVDAEMGKQDKVISYRHVMYFLVKQKQGDDATLCKYDADQMVQDLLAFLSLLRTTVMQGRTEITSPFNMQLSTYREGLKGLQIDSASWATIPMKWNGWWICGLELTELVPRQLCINTTKYNE